MNLSSHSIWPVLCAVLLSALPLQPAKAGFLNPSPATPTFGESSLVVGTAPLYMRYDRLTWYDETAWVAQLGSPKSNLLLAYGESSSLYGRDLLGRKPYSSSMLLVNLQLGGNANIWDQFLRLPLEIYIPIRFNAGYQRLGLSYDLAVPRTFSEAGLFRERDDKHFLNFNLGAGIGGTLRLPLDDIPLLGSRISIDAMLLRSPGIMIRIIDDEAHAALQGDSENEVGFSASTDLLLQARIHRFLESNIGLTTGMRFNGLNWSQDSTDIGDIINALLGSELPDNRLRYVALYLGINW